jgi:hypothetical protein
LKNKDFVLNFPSPYNAIASVYTVFATAYIVVASTYISIASVHIVAASTCIVLASAYIVVASAYIEVASTRIVFASGYIALLLRLNLHFTFFPKPCVMPLLCVNGYCITALRFKYSKIILS